MQEVQVSVITCLYNTPPELFKKCLLSISKQTFTDFEVLIVNDGSTKYLDENKKIIESFKDNRFKYFDTEHTGKSQTLNYAFKIAQGKYIAICDSDDQMKDIRLEYQYRFLEDNNEYDVISNAMITDDDHIIFPSTESSHEANEKNFAWSTLHPCMMLNRENVLNTVPFLFSQIYDSMEDAVFNQIMYNYGIRMWYDSEILQVYSHKNESSVHYDNVNNKWKKDCTFKLNYRTFNYKDDKPKYTTAILLVNDKWKTDIEKTILNIRMTSNNVNILVVDYSKKQLNLSYLYKYNVKVIYDNKTYINALIEGINNCETNYYMIISKPIRFYTQDWDLIYERYIETFPYFIIQPYIFGIDKIDENYYVNENGKILNKDVRCGLKLTLFDKLICKKSNELKFYSEYLTDTNIESLDEDLIFFGITSDLKQILKGLNLFNISTYIALYISIAISLNYKNVKLNKDVICGVINDNFIDNTYNYDTHYYINMFNLICLFCSESKYIYEKILYDSFNDKVIPKKIVNDHLNNIDEFNKIKDSLNFKYDLSYFLKKNNMSKQWVLTNQAY